jgi:hypothetical protein
MYLTYYLCINRRVLFFLQVILERILPYTEGRGVRLSTGETLSYRINGHLTLWLAVFICEHFFPLTYLYDHYVRLAVLFFFLFSFFLVITRSCSQTSTTTMSDLFFFNLSESISFRLGCGGGNLNSVKRSKKK